MIRSNCTLEVTHTHAQSHTYTSIHEHTRGTIRFNSYLSSPLARYVWMWIWTDVYFYYYVLYVWYPAEVWYFIFVNGAGWNGKKSSIGFYILITCLFIPMFEIGAHQFLLCANSFFLSVRYRDSVDRRSQCEEIFTLSGILGSIPVTSRPVRQINFVLIKWIIIVYLPFSPSVALSLSPECIPDEKLNDNL